MSEYGKVAVLMGGQSAEREVSLSSGEAVLNALLTQGIDAHKIDVGPALVNQLQQGQYDCAFVVLHGPAGEDGTVQAILEWLKIPYTGSGVMASAISMDKMRCKWLWQGVGLPTPKSMLCPDSVSDDDILAHLSLPLAIKPTELGSSLGISKVTSAKQLPAARALAAQYGTVMAEEWVDGREYSVGIVDGVILPSIWIDTPRQFYDYDAEYVEHTTEYHCPSGLSDKDEHHMQQLAWQAYQALDLKNWGRMDFMRDAQTGQFYLIESNPITGMTPTSLVPKAARQYGWSFEELVMRVLRSRVC